MPVVCRQLNLILYLLPHPGMHQWDRGWWGVPAAHRITAAALPWGHPERQKVSKHNTMKMGSFSGSSTLYAEKGQHRGLLERVLVACDQSCCWGTNWASGGHFWLCLQKQVLVLHQLTTWSTQTPSAELVHLPVTSLQQGRPLEIPLRDAPAS